MLRYRQPGEKSLRRDACKEAHCDRSCFTSRNRALRHGAPRAARNAALRAVLGWAALPAAARRRSGPAAPTPGSAPLPHHARTRTASQAAPRSYLPPRRAPAAGAPAAISYLPPRLPIGPPGHPAVPPLPACPSLLAGGATASLPLVGSNGQRPIRAEGNGHTPPLRAGHAGSCRRCELPPPAGALPAPHLSQLCPWLLCSPLPPGRTAEEPQRRCGVLGGKQSLSPVPCFGLLCRELHCVRGWRLREAGPRISPYPAPQIAGLCGTQRQSCAGAELLDLSQPPWTR